MNCGRNFDADPSSQPSALHSTKILDIPFSICPFYSFSFLLYVLGGCSVTISLELPHLRLPSEFGHWETPTEMGGQETEVRVLILPTPSPTNLVFLYLSPQPRLEFLQGSSDYSLPLPLQIFPVLPISEYFASSAGSFICAHTL